MKIKNLVVLLLLCLVYQITNGQGANPALLIKSQRIALLLTQDSGYVVEKMAAKPFKEALESSAATLSGVFAQVTGNFGKVSRIEQTRYVAGSYYVPIKYAKDSIFLSLHYDALGMIDGLFFRPKVKLPPTWKVPDYVLKGTENSTVKFVSDGLEFTGHVMVPPVENRLKIVALLLTGSGPNDYKGTIGPNQYLSDVAYGLAAEGISSFRYDKRTYSHPETINANKVTPEEEVIQDAVSALNYLKSSPDYSGYKIVLIGHSLSAMLGPEIAKRAKFIAGAALLGTPAQRMEVMITNQMNYLMADKADTAEVRKQGAEFVKLIQGERYKGLDAAQLFGMPAAYWKWLSEYDVIKAGKKVKTPFYVVQGGRDYQVTNTDFELLKKGWGKRRNTTFRYYESTNHLLMEGEGKPSPAEYDVSNHVDIALVRNMAGWMKSL